MARTRQQNRGVPESGNEGTSTAVEASDLDALPRRTAKSNRVGQESLESLSGPDSPPSSSELKGKTTATTEMENLSRKSQWIVLALASGACAAFNGVFAKLTTTELTTIFATWIANVIGLSKVEGGVEVVVRAIFFGLNLIFNGIMWTLFTKALARGTSTTQVSILNTSSNFMLTAVLGWMIFSESLPPLWFAGAALLVAGNVIIGRREEGEDKSADVENGDGTRYGEQRHLLEGEELGLDTDVEGKGEHKRRKDQEEGILDLGLDEDEGRKSVEVGRV